MPSEELINMEKLISIINRLITKGFEPFGKYYSFYRAIVIGRDDPDGLNRIRVIIPDITGNNPFPTWIPRRVGYAGAGHGMQVIPQLDEVVTVAFHMGNPRFPYWEHGYFALRNDGQDHDIDEEELRDANLYWFKSPNGHKVIIDDTADRIRVIHSSGREIRIGETIDLYTPEQELINLGSFDESGEFAVKGNTRQVQLEDLLDAIQTLTVPTAFGPSGTPINAASFLDVKAVLENANSTKIKLD